MKISGAVETLEHLASWAARGRWKEDRRPLPDGAGPGPFLAGEGLTMVWSHSRLKVKNPKVSSDRVNDNSRLHGTPAQMLAHPESNVPLPKGRSAYIHYDISFWKFAGGSGDR